MTENKHTLGLFSAISTLGPAALATVLRERDVIAPAAATALDIASQLAKPDAVLAQLRLLNSKELAALESLQRGVAPEVSTLPAHSDDRLLTHTSGGQQRLRPDVAQVWPSVTEARATPASSGQPETPSWLAGGDLDLTQVVGTVEAVEMLLHSVRSHPIDSPGEPPSQCVWAGRLDPNDDTQRNWELIAEIARRCGLLVHTGGSWRIGARGIDLLHQPLATRMARLARGIWDQLPVWVSEQIDGALAGSTRPALPPLVTASDWSHWSELAAHVGLVGASGPTVLSAALREARDDEAAIAQALPNPTDQLYADGPDSVVAAGIVNPDLEATLRSIARWDSGGLAPRFVFSTASIVDALQRGVDGAIIEEVINTSIPGGATSALGQLVTEATRKATMVTLQPREDGSRVLVGDPMIQQLLHSDRRLASLGLQEVGNGVFHTNTPAVDAHTLLLEEGYPHLVRDPMGERVNLAAGELAATPAVGAGWSVEQAETLVDHWRALREDSPTEWFAPVIDLAIESGGALEVTVDMGESSAVLQLELRSVGNGRLRARDIRSDVERTIPVNRIVSMAPGPVPGEES